MKIESQIEKISSFQHLELLANQIVEGFISGMHKSPFHGFSAEFAEHKVYNVGESTKHIDWKLFAKTDRLYTKKFEEDWYNPLKNSLNAVNGKGVFFVPGNHDWDTRGVEGVWPYKYPYIIEFLLKTIDNQLGKDDYYYSFDIGNVHFACPGIYPADDEGNPMEWVAALLYGKKRLYVNRGSLEWLKNDLKNHTYPGQPIIIFFHYTLTGFASGGSKKSEKDAFENLIKDNNYNVKAIINGHSHFNDSNFWRGIWQINVSGDKFALITYDPNNDELKMGFVNEYGNFVNKNGDAIGEPQPKPTGIADGEEQHAPEDSPTNGI